jgi:uncharacterized protein (TIGR01777 family)
MKIVIFAANGYIGNVLVDYFLHKKQEVVAITRRPSTFPPGVENLLWDGRTLQKSWTQGLENADLVINLAGKSVNCRYNAANKREIFDSRTYATEAIAKAIQQCQYPPKLWVNAASATIYRHAEDRPMDEIGGELGTGFSVEVCKKWEKTFFDSPTPHTRKIALRMAIVLGSSDGVFLRLQNLVRYGLGGKQGNGRQMFSWIHDQDLCRVFDFLLANEQLSGIFNVASPHPISNAHLMKTIRQAMKVSFGFPASSWLLKIGAVLIGTETELILKSRWVVPTRLVNAGFVFECGELESAIACIIETQKVQVKRESHD